MGFSSGSDSSGNLNAEPANLRDVVEGRGYGLALLLDCLAGKGFELIGGEVEILRETHVAAQAQRVLILQRLRHAFMAVALGAEEASLALWKRWQVIHVASPEKGMRQHGPGRK
jgi:hypothetical protein